MGEYRPMRWAATISAAVSVTQNSDPDGGLPREAVSQDIFYTHRSKRYAIVYNIGGRCMIGMVHPRQLFSAPLRALY
jgi:hypothetical protein